MQRRTFLTRSLGALGAGLAPALPGCGGEAEPLDTSRLEKPEELKFFTAESAPIMRAILARLLPAEGPGPSAEEVDVFRYMDRQLILPRHAEIRTGIQRGCGYISALARRENGNKAFYEIPPEAQDALLARFQQNDVPFQFPASLFFQHTLALAFEGYFGHPRYGGNRNKLAWHWVGIDPTCGHLYQCDE